MAGERPKGKAKKGTREKAGLKRAKHRPIEDILRGATPLPTIRRIEDAQRAALLPSTRLFASVDMREALDTRLFASVDMREALDTRLLASVDMREALDTRLFASVDMREALDTRRLLESLNLHEALGTRLLESLNLHEALGTRLLESLNLREALGTRLLEAVNTQLARIVEPWGSAFASGAAWEASLTARMATLQTQWALRDCLDQSVIGFAHLSRLSDAVHTEEPYSELVGELVNDELGDGVEAEEEDNSPASHDTAAIEAGLNPDLIAFPPSAYSKVVIAVGFNFRLPPSPMPQAVESADPDAVFDPIHGRVMTELEQRLRNIVEKCLKALDGEKWMKRRVHEQVRKRWLERQEEDRQAGRPVYPPIQYADFMDLADVIGRADNWRDAFEPIFRNRDDLMVSFRRLHPVRNALAHSRPLGRVYVLTLVSEATRIFNALGIPVLN